MKVRPSTLLIYAVILAVVAFMARTELSLIVPAIPNFILGLYFTIRRRLYMVIVAFALAVWALFLNALFFVNYGEPVLALGPIVVRENALRATMIVAFRLMTLVGPAMVFISNVEPRELIKSLERDLGLPKGLAFALSLAVRLIPLMNRDYEEIMHVRRERGFRRIPLTPNDIKTLLTPLVAVGIDRAYWIGIAAELRGFSLRKRVFKPGFKLIDYTVMALAVVQLVIVVFITPLLS